MGMSRWEDSVRLDPLVVWQVLGLSISACQRCDEHSRPHSPTCQVHRGQSCGFPATLSSLHSTAFLTVPISRGPFRLLKVLVGGRRCLGECRTVRGLGWRDRRVRLFWLCREEGRTCRMVCRQVARLVAVDAGRSGGVR